MKAFVMYSTKLDNSLPLHPQISPRLLHRKLNIIQHAVQVIEKQKGRVTSQSVAEYLGMSVDDYNYILQDANFYRLFNSKQEAA